VQGDEEEERIKMPDFGLTIAFTRQTSSTTLKHERLGSVTAGVCSEDLEEHIVALL